MARSISVMPGDTVKTEVFAKYLDPNSSNWTTALNNLITSIANGTAPPGTYIDGGAPGSTGGIPAPFLGLLNKGDETGTAPKAYLNYLIFDLDYNLVNGGFVRMTTAAREYGQDGAHEKLAAQFVITEAGYVYIYLSNDNVALGGPQIETYWDDFKVEQVKSPVIQAQDYYPFGLTFNSYQRENSADQKYLYNGKEFQDELDLGWLDYGMRMYQPELGRFFTQDRFTEKYLDFTPYQYGANNPILFVDINGDSLAVKELDAGAIDKFKNIIQNGSGGYYLANVDSKTGIVSLVENKDIEGKMTKDQAAFVKELSGVTTGNGVATINLANNSENVVIGDIASNTIDVGDMTRLGTDGKITAQKTLIHEARENYEVQVNGQTAQSGHMRASNAENRIGDAILSPLGRYITPNASNSNFSVLQVPVIGPQEQRGTISIHLYKNNVLRTSGNSSKPLLPLPKR